MAGRDLIVGAVKLPDFLLTHNEYQSITVPQMKITSEQIVPTRDQGRGSIPPLRVNQSCFVIFTVLDTCINFCMIVHIN